MFILNFEQVQHQFSFLHHCIVLVLSFYRPQIVKLLQKFHRNNYMEDVRGYKYNTEIFEENNRLFR